MKEAFHQFAAYAALDAVDLAQRSAESMCLGVVDRAIGPDGASEWLVSAYITLSGYRLLLLHELKIDEGILKSFFWECHQALRKVKCLWR